MPDAAHRRRRSDTRHRWVIATVATVVAAATAATTVFVLTRVKPAPAGAASTKPPEALQVVASSPAPDATGVAPDAALSVDFTVPLANDTPVPSLNPPVAGQWVQTAPNVLAFDATAPLPPGATVSLTVPDGPDGVRGASGQTLADPLTTRFTVAPMSTLRLQQLLAQLGYLPLTFTPSSSPASGIEAASPQVGTFAWRFTMPSTFSSLWSPGEPNVVTQGAVMAFEDQEQLATDGVAGPKVWSALLQAAAANQVDTDADYDWADVSTSLPEHVDIWRNGRIAYTTVANTGIEAAPTELGTWPVYARYTSTTMSGFNPDGSHYSDPGVPWVSYFHGGDALHGFVRSSYGYPQSLGCVELPPANAEVVYPYTPLGTLVTVQ